MGPLRGLKGWEERDAVIASLGERQKGFGEGRMQPWHLCCRGIKGWEGQDVAPDPPQQPCSHGTVGQDAAHPVAGQVPGVPP